MLAIGSRALARITALAFILGLFASADAANAAEAGRYAPENIEQTYKQMRWLCVIAVLCPVSDDVRIVIKRDRGQAVRRISARAYFTDRRQPAARRERRHRLDGASGRARRSRCGARHRRSPAQRRFDRRRRNENCRCAQAKGRRRRCRRHARARPDGYPRPGRQAGSGARPRHDEARPGVPASRLSFSCACG
jgi:hypothetical protein